MNRTLRAIQAVGLRPSARRIALVSFRRPPITNPTLRTRARFLADGPASKPNAGKQHLSTHAFSSEAGSSSGAGADPIAKETTLTGRLKALIKTYGWYALGVYTIIGVVDFSISFGAIQILGKEKVAEATHWVKEKSIAVIGDWWPQKAHDDKVKEVVDVASGNSATVDGKAGLWATIVLAYAVHKTLFLPFRVGATAGFTPVLVKWLQTKGWAGVAGTKRAAQAARAQMQKRTP
ncbi:hypothetical protein CALVIDRAFT_426275 [Calocera viscosa TUFC12733]|uniref:DUF1279 domain-containing protein n=1 Tax=Calocera viscosa (strain TUFC12733) TaxID=1330018 RepID=A0A167PKD7_CALVF|nr:hypothetical protein CALVIDRAFT_426275 [Calocera viscosa TUFC12733]